MEYCNRISFLIIFLVMVSIVLEYVSLVLQVAAAAIAISLFKRTKFNSSWILI